MELGYFLRKKTKMELIDCTERYWEFVRKLRTDEKNTSWFYTQPTITSEDQIKYMTNNSYRYKICIHNGVEVGYIGLLDNNEITYCVDSNYKNLGIGTFMVTEFMRIYDNLIAFVIPQNISSSKVFEKLGFEKHYFYKYKKI